MSSARAWTLLLASYAVLVAVSCVLRPLMPVDETRYVTVAWEMWARGDWLVPHLNGEPYHHKPPLLFWLIHAGWGLFGVGETWPRLLSPLLTLLDVALLARLAATLWPTRASAPIAAPLLFLGSWFAAIYSTALNFEALLLACVLGAWLALWRAATRAELGAWLAFGACLGLGMLAKGPVVLVYTVPLALLVRAWTPDRTHVPRAQWASGLFLSLTIAVAVPALWVAAAAEVTDGTFLHHLLIDQTADRLTGRIGHGRPFWWYVARLPLLALPWLLWPAVWRGLAAIRVNWAEPGIRFALIGWVSAVVLLSSIGGKQVHYLVPVIALSALVVARGLPEHASARWRDAVLPALGMTAVPVGAVLFVVTEGGHAALDSFRASTLALGLMPGLVTLWLLRHRAHTVLAQTTVLGATGLLFAAILVGAVFWVLRPRYELTAASRYIAEQQQADRPVALLAGAYQGEFGFQGRLTTPIPVLNAARTPAWLAAHPNGLLVVRRKRIEADPPVQTEFAQPYKSDALLMFDAATLLRAPARFRDGVN